MLVKEITNWLGLQSHSKETSVSSATAYNHMEKNRALSHHISNYLPVLT